MMRVLLVLVVAFADFWLADTFGFSGYYPKKIRREAEREIYLVNQQIDNVIRAVTVR
jgi:hypothetical protein